MIKFEEFENILNHINTLAWHREDGYVDAVDVYNIALENFERLTNGRTKNKVVFRTIGQSGSGKTTQLLKATEAYCENKKLLPVHICVRKFAELHPDYKELLGKFGSAKIREITNEFALKCALVSLILAAEQGYDIIFEITLLSEEFEKFVEKYLSRYAYKVTYLCVSVNRQVSDFLIGRRMSDSRSAENGRIVATESMEFFYNSLISSLSAKSKYSGERIIIWNAYDMLPVFDGEIKNCMAAFEKEQKKTSRNFVNEQDLLDAKTNYLIKNCRLD